MLLKPSLKMLRKVMGIQASMCPDNRHRRTPSELISSLNTASSNT